MNSVVTFFLELKWWWLRNSNRWENLKSKLSLWLCVCLHILISVTLFFLLYSHSVLLRHSLSACFLRPRFHFIILHKFQYHRRRRLLVTWPAVRRVWRALLASCARAVRCVGHFVSFVYFFNDFFLYMCIIYIFYSLFKKRTLYIKIWSLYKVFLYTFTYISYIFIYIFVLF